MNNNTIRINSYLQNEMSAEEKSIFEAELIVNRDLQEEVEVQQRIAEAAFNAGLKQVFAKSLRKKMLTQKIIQLIAVISICLITALVFKFTGSSHEKSTDKAINKITRNGEKQVLTSFINPPLASIDVPYTDYSFDAEKGDTLFIPSGSIVYFPPFALTDGAGNLIQGTVNIRYREFSSPVDFFVSGIPMGYDSAGKKYNFESSGMCEIYAYQNDKNLFINPLSKPEINLSGYNNSPLHSLYFLDTVNRKWNYIGKDVITEVKNLPKGKSPLPSARVSENNYTHIPVKPIRPIKANENRQSFSIEIDPGSFEELFAYDKLKFEVTDASTYRRSDADEHWDVVKLKPGSAEGIYTITFTNSARSVSYRVRPVLEGADYAAGLKVFNEKNKEYEQALKTRMGKERKESDSIKLRTKVIKEKIKADNDMNNLINRLITERNKKIRQESQLSSEVIRSFAINNFGIWNCDHPQYPSKEIPIFASYEDMLGNKLALSSAAVVYRGFNGLAQFPSLQIRVMPQEDNMIWSIQDASFFYFTYKNFKESGITPETKAFTFKMQKASKKITSYDEIKALTEKL